MASRLHSPAAVAESEMRAGDKENLSEDGGTVFKRPALHKEVPSSARGKKKAAGFNLRKSIAWNPAFFTEEGVLDTSELSVLIGSELVANGSPSSDVNRKMSPLCRPGRYGSTSVLREVADNPCEKSSAKLHWTGNHGKRLFSSAKTPQRDERKAPLVIQNRSSARNIEKGMPRVPAGSAQKRVPNSTSIALMSRTPKKPISSLHMAPRSTTPVTTLSKSNKKFAPVKTESIHRVPVLLPKSKINSGPSMETDLVPAVAPRYEETNGSVTSKNPEICISSLAGTPSTIAKPSALRMPSHSVGFFTQENAHISHGNAAERNTGRFSAGNTSLLVKPPRHKQPVDLNSGLFLSNLLSTNRTTTTNLVSQRVITESNTNNLVSSEKRSLSKIISTYSSKSGDVNFKEQPEVCCSLAGSGATIQPLTLEKNKGARNSMTTVHKDTTDVQRKVIIKEIEPIANLTSFKATCSTRPTMGSKLPQPCISSESNDLSYQNKKDTGSVAATDLENSCVGEKAIAISFSEDQMPTSGSSSDGSPDRADRKYILNDSLYDDGDFALSEEPNTDGGTNHEINKAPLVTEDPLLHVGCEHNHSLKRTKCSSVSHRAPMTCMGRQNVLSAELNTEDKMVFGSNKLLAQEGVSHIAKDKEEDRSRTDTILRDHLRNLVPFTEEWLAVMGDHLRNLVPFTEEWLAVMEAFGQEVLEQKSGTVQNSPPDKTAPEPSPWSPVKRKAQDVGPFDCTKYSKNVRTSVSP